MKIYVGNFDYQVTDEELKAAFQAYGDVESVTIISDRDTGRSRGFGFVEMPQRDQALAAINGLNETELGGRTITVSEARPKPAFDDRRGGFGGGGDRGGDRGGRRGGRRGGPGGGRRGESGGGRDRF